MIVNEHSICHITCEHENAIRLNEHDDPDYNAEIIPAKHFIRGARKKNEHDNETHIAEHLY